MGKDPKLTRRHLLGASAAMIAMASPRAVAAAKGLIVQRLDWAGVRLVCDGVELLIDVSAAPPTLEPAPGRTYALATHPHGDHFNADVLAPLLGARGYAVLHEDAAALIDRRALKLQTVELYEPVFFSRGGGAMVAWAVPAVDGFGDPQVSWVVDAGGRRIIHCGDTLWHGHWWRIARAYGPFDAAFLPINGARQPGGMYSDVGQPMMMGPEKAAAAALALGAKLTIPIHYGSDAEGYFEIDDALGKFRRAAEKRGLRFSALSPSETMTL